MPSRLAFSVLALVTLVGCVVGTDPPTSGAKPDGGSSTSGDDATMIAGDPCADTCASMPRDFELSVTDGNYGSPEAQKWATCFSCRCKSALVEMPRPEELSCSTASGPLTRWKATRDAAGAVTGVAQIDPNGADTTDCLNPGMAAAGCDLQARFKRILTNSGKTEFQQLCRKRDVGSTGYYEYLLIGHNTQNGATCFWQARDSTFGGEDVPTLDLVGATNAVKAKYAQTFYLYSAGPSTCTNCHATDAFLTSPYLTSAWSIQQANADPMTRNRIRSTAPYSLVTADKERPEPVVADDVAAPGKPLAAQCGSCHKVAKGQYCNFATRSLSEDRIVGLTPADQGVLFAQGKQTFSWMPPGGVGTHGQALALQDTVRTACAN